MTRGRLRTLARPRIRFSAAARTRILLARTAVLATELGSVIRQSQALCRRAQIGAYGAVPIRGGSDVEVLAAALSAPTCHACIARKTDIPGARIGAVLERIAAFLKVDVQSGRCDTCLEQKATIYRLAVAPEASTAPPAGPITRAEAVWRFLERHRGDAFCTACLAIALKATGRLDRAVFGAEGRGARRIHAVCGMCGQPRLVCGL